MPNVGFGVADITPDVGMEMPGGFGRKLSKGVAEKLLAVACVVQDGGAGGTSSGGSNASSGKPIALVGIDALFAPKSVVAAARAAAEKSAGVPAAHILVGANHTHTGGPCMDGFGSTCDARYLERMSVGIAEAVTQAAKSLHAAEVGIATGREDTIAYNRRFVMRDGREITHPGKPGTPRHGEIVRVAGPMDPDVGVLAVRDGMGRLLGVVVNYACHSTVIGGDRYHPDYTAFLRSHLRARFGEGLPVLFLNGACGDVTQVDNLSTGREFGPEHSELMGAKLAAEAVRTIRRMSFAKELPVAAAMETATVRMRDEPDADRERPEFGLGSGKVAEDIFAAERPLVAAERQQTPKLDAELQALRLGPLGVVANGAELFCELGLRIKGGSPFSPTWVVTMANENIGYVPTPTAFYAGGYEPRTARSSKLTADAGQLLVEASLRALRRLAPKAEEAGGRK